MPECNELPIKSRQKKFISQNFLLLCAALSVLIGLSAGYGLIMGGKQFQQKQQTAMESQSLPEVSFTDADGDDVDLDDFKDTVVLVNLWATWCTPCVAELPALDDLQARFDPSRFRIVAIALDRDKPEKIRAFLKKNKIEKLGFYWDSNREIPAKWKYAGIPASFLIDRDGRVVETFEGPREWAGEEMIAKISALVPAAGK